MPPTTAARNRSDRLVRNDDAILDAGVRVAATAGWGEFTATTVARISGLSKRPVLERHPTRADLATAVWLERCGPTLRDALERLLEAPDVDTQAAALRAFVRPSHSLKAAAELLTVAQFDDTFRGTVARTFGEPLGRQTLPEGRTPEQAALRSYRACLALGLLWIDRTLGTDPNLPALLEGMLTTLGEPAEAPEVRNEPAEHLHLDVFETGDAIRDALLTASLEIVSNVGYEAATTARIAKKAAVSEGALFARFPTKLALFVEATDLHAQASLMANENYQQALTAAYGPGTSEAMIIREFMRPGREYLQRLNLEQLRVGWHDVVLRRLVKDRIDTFVAQVWSPTQGRSVDDVHAAAHASLGVSTGAVVMALLVPQAAILPYEVATIPLEDSL